MEPQSSTGQRIVASGSLWKRLVAGAHKADNHIFSVSVWLACSWTCWLILYHAGYERPWYRIQDMMVLNGQPPFQHRMLFVWIAQSVKAVLPTTTYLQCFYLSQIVAILLSFHFIKKWAELFAPREMAFAAQPILAIMLMSTITYYTFYDIAIVFFYTICLTTLFQQKFLQYLIFFGLGTLNHENTLLLIPVFIAVYFDSDMPRPTFLRLIVLQGFIYGTIRLLLFYFLPASQAWEPGKIWFNLDLLLHHPWPLFVAFGSLIFWYVMATLGMKHASVALKRSALVLMPLLLLTVLVFGQLNEARHFNPFIPIAIALIMVSAQSIKASPARS